MKVDGSQSHDFYTLCKWRGLNWKKLILDSSNLRLIDIHYDREFNEMDGSEAFNTFLENTRDDFNTKYPAKNSQKPRARIENGIVKIGYPGKGNFLRIYIRAKGKEVRFELELSQYVVKKFTSELFTNHFEILEEQLCIYFYKRCIKSLKMDRLI